MNFRSWRFKSVRIKDVAVFREIHSCLFERHFSGFKKGNMYKRAKVPSGGQAVKLHFGEKKIYLKQDKQEGKNG